MALFLVEFHGLAIGREGLPSLFDRVAEAARAGGGDFVEAQVSTDAQQVFVIVEHDDEAGLHRALDEAAVPARASARVRLVGTTLDAIKASRPRAEYLVEWDFPAGLTMDAYLERKRARAPLYAQVPEVRFLRTYVCEDMSRCLCFYLAHDEAAVRRARDVVSAPISRLTALGEPAVAGAGAPAVGVHGPAA
jgi:hypothetical protein